MWNNWKSEVLEFLNFIGISTKNLALIIEKRYVKLLIYSNKWTELCAKKSCLLYIVCDFTDPASPQMEALIDLHHDILFFLIFILTFVGWIIGSILFYFNENISSTVNLKQITCIQITKWSCIQCLITFCFTCIGFGGFSILNLTFAQLDVGTIGLCMGCLQKLKNFANY